MTQNMDNPFDSLRKRASQLSWDLVDQRERGLGAEAQEEAVRAFLSEKQQFASPLFTREFVRLKQYLRAVLNNEPPTGA